MNGAQHTDAPEAGIASVLRGAGRPAHRLTTVFSTLGSMPPKALTRALAGPIIKFFLGHFDMIDSAISHYRIIVGVRIRRGVSPVGR